MPTNTTRNTLHEYARIGAVRRLEELRQEEARIRSAFPELFRSGRRPAAAEAAQPAEAQSGGRSRKRRRSGMSTAQRKAVSERMKKYWAARRKAKNG